MKVLNEHDGIKIGDRVAIIGGHRHGVVESITDFGTHISFFVNVWTPVKFAAKREWITKIEEI